MRSKSEPQGPGPRDYNGHRLALRFLLEDQTKLVDALLHEMASTKRARSVDQEELVTTTLLMVHGLGVSIHSILKLTAELGLSIRDCLGIGRSIAETGLNVAYIWAGGVEVARRAKRHALQKNYRDLDRQASFGGYAFKFGVAEKSNLSAHPELAIALEEFTRRNGREVSEWTADNLDRRVAIIRDRYGEVAVGFAGALAAIYRHSSEVLHGTYFGSIHFWSGSGQGAQSRPEAEFTFIAEHLVSIFGAVFGTVHSLIDVLAQELSLAEINEANRRLLRTAHEYNERFLSKMEPPAALRR